MASTMHVVVSFNEGENDEEKTGEEITPEGGCGDEGEEAQDWEDGDEEEEKTHECELCPGQTFTERMLYHHHMRHHIPDNNNCPFCERTFSDHHSVTIHLWYVHGAEMGRAYSTAEATTTPKQFELLKQQQLEAALEYFGVPKQYQRLVRQGFILEYDQTIRMPRWGFYSLAATDKSQVIHSKFMKWSADPDPLVEFQSTTAGIKFLEKNHVGHVVPAAVARVDKQSLRESFYMTNVMPMNGNINIGAYGQLERHARKMLCAYDRVSVFTGPVIGSSKPTCVPGGYRLPEPVAFFTIIALEHKDRSVIFQAFLIPNKREHLSFWRFRTTVKEIRRVTGINFVSNFPSPTLTWSPELKSLQHQCRTRGCRKFFISSAVLKEHIAVAHNEKIKCFYCSETFTTKEELRVHTTVHKIHTCKVDGCGKCFPTPSALSVHAKVHNGEKRKWPCDLCNRSFHSQRQMQDHMNYHNGIRPYICTECGADFFSQNALGDHQRRACTGEYPAHRATLKRFSCPYCSTGFTELRSLKRHLDKRCKQKNDKSRGPCIVVPNKSTGLSLVPKKPIGPSSVATNKSTTWPSSVATNKAKPSSYNLCGVDNKPTKKSKRAIQEPTIKGRYKPNVDPDAGPTESSSSMDTVTTHDNDWYVPITFEH